MIVIMIRTRKTGSVTMINYLTSSFVYTKVANLILWFYADVRMGILFAFIFIRKRRCETISLMNSGHAKSRKVNPRNWNLNIRNEMFRKIIRNIIIIIELCIIETLSHFSNFRIDFLEHYIIFQISAHFFQDFAYSLNGLFCVTGDNI